MAEEQSRLLRKGIGDIFVNLARRNQRLLDRQIEFIDQLEANEEDPDQLDNLFKLDHLATRMRRNAESLLVLAGAEPPRRRGRPVPVADVVRVAIGEVEDFSRVHLLALDDATDRRERRRRPGPPAVRAHGERHPLLAAGDQRRGRRASRRSQRLRPHRRRSGHRHERRAARRGQRAAGPPAARRPDAVPVAGLHRDRPAGQPLRPDRAPSSPRPTAARQRRSASPSPWSSTRRTADSDGRRDAAQPPARPPGATRPTPSGRGDRPSTSGAEPSLHGLSARRSTPPHRSASLRPPRPRRPSPAPAPPEPAPVERHGPRRHGAARPPRPRCRRVRRPASRVASGARPRRSGRSR